MAYTYNDFVVAANNAGSLNRFSQEDLTIAEKKPEYGLSMVSLIKDIDNATTAEQRLLATEAVNQLRKNYGAYGTATSYAGSYDSRINDLLGKLDNYGSFDYSGQGQLQQMQDRLNNYGSFNYGNQGQLQQAQDKVNNFGSFSYDNQGQLDQLQGQIQNYSPFSYGNETVYQQLLNAVVNQQPFNYDQMKDPSYSALKKTYLREGERAGANALAQAAAASGGQISSYAALAAQQANNYYAGQLADIVPTLEQNAYQRYLSDIQGKLSSLSALQSDRAQEQQQWQNGYNMLQNNLANLQSDRNFSYQDYLTQYEQAMNALSNLQGDRAQAQEEWLNGYNMLQNKLGILQNLDETSYNRYLDQIGEQQRQFENALTMYNLLGYATPEIAAILGIPDSGEPENNGQYYDWSPAPSPEPDPEPEETPTLSSTGQRFMASLPYANSGSDIQTWKNVVNERLAGAYANGTLDENDVAIIATRLGLYDTAGGLNTTRSGGGGGGR